MKRIQELIEIVNPNKLKGLEILGKSDTIIDKLYHALRSGKIMNDKDALRMLYNDSKSKTALYQTKEKLYNKLLDSLFIIDQKERNHSEYHVAYTDSLKYTAVFEFLSGRNDHNNILTLGNKILKKAIKYNLADTVVRVSKILARKYVLIEGDEKKLDYYHSLCDKYSRLAEINRLAEYYWYKISVKFKKKSIVQEQGLTIKAKKFIDDLEPKLVPGHRCISFAYLILLKIRKAEIEQNFEEVIEIVDKNLPTLKTYPDFNSSIHNGVTSKKLSALITLRKYKEATKTAKQNLKFLREGQKTWFTLLDSIITLYFYEKKYELSFDTYSKAVNHSSFKFLSDSRKEMYKLFRAYFQFFINIGMLDYPDELKSKKPLRYARFSNEVHIFTQDKKGINTSIIIAQFLLLFTEGKYREANEKIDSIKSYARKHLKLDETFRSRCFLKMLVKLVESDFHKAATIRKTKDLYEKLKNQPPNAKRLRSDVEIVPFEHLWEIIIDRIDNSFRGVFRSKKKQNLQIKKE